MLALLCTASSVAKGGCIITGDKSGSRGATGRKQLKVAEVFAMLSPCRLAFPQRGAPSVFGSRLDPRVQVAGERAVSFRDSKSGHLVTPTQFRSSVQGFALLGFALTRSASPAPQLMRSVTGAAEGNREVLL